MTDNTVVCIKHFVPHFIITTDSVTRPDGSVLTVARKIPKLTVDAYPSVFENCPSYLSTEPPPKRRNPDERRAAMNIRDEQGFSDCMESYRITSLSSLRDQLRALQISDEWKYLELDDSVILYILDVSNIDRPTVKTSVSIHDDLNACVCQAGQLVDINKFTWVLGSSGRVDCITKLTPLLSF